jgi:hypothetical protein
MADDGGLAGRHGGTSNRQNGQMLSPPLQMLLVMIAAQALLVSDSPGGASANRAGGLAPVKATLPLPWRDHAGGSDRQTRSRGSQGAACRARSNRTLTSVNQSRRISLGKTPRASG